EARRSRAGDFEAARRNPAGRRGGGGAPAPARAGRSPQDRACCAGGDSRDGAGGPAGAESDWRAAGSRARRSPAAAANQCRVGSHALPQLRQRPRKERELSSAALRYASVLADVALARGNAEAVRAGLEGFVEAAAGSAELRNFLANPAVPLESKQAVLEKIVARLGAGAELRNFLFLLVDHRRTELLGEIGAAFEAELRTRLGVAEAQVLSARELSAGEKAELTGALERVTGKKIEAR